MTGTAELFKVAEEAGVDRLGVAACHTVPDRLINEYRRWLDGHNHAQMGYLERYPDVRRDPAQLLPGARSVISCAFSYYHTTRQRQGVPTIAMYAHGDDYHEVIRELLRPVASFIESRYGGATRVCVDTAPIHERFWAVEAGVGFKGKNGLVIVPGLGSYCFLAEIVTTVPFEPNPRLEIDACSGCGRCVKACPGHALRGDGTLDANNCISYLTIEHRGDLPERFCSHGRLYGCDTCQVVCPHNEHIKEGLHKEFDLRAGYMNLGVEEIENMTQSEYSALFKGSAIKRAKLAGLQRNVKHL